MNTVLPGLYLSLYRHGPKIIIEHFFGGKVPRGKSAQAVEVPMHPWTDSVVGLSPSPRRLPPCACLLPGLPTELQTHIQLPNWPAWHL